MASQQELNAEVTMAIVKAEEGDRQVTRLWERVTAAERALAEHPETPDAERAIARRGVVSAQRRVELLHRAARADETRFDELAIKLVLLFRPELEQDTADFMRVAERARLLIAQVVGA